MVDHLRNAYKAREVNQEKKDQDAIRHPVTGDTMELGEHDRSMRDILDDKKSHDDFLNHYLYQQNSGEATNIVEALKNGTPLSKKQDTFLEKHRKGFNLLSAHIEKVREGLTAEEMKHIAALDPRIATVVGKVNPEQAAELFGQEMAKLAMRDTKRFDKIVKGMQNIHTIHTGEDARRAEANVQEHLQKYGLSDEVFIKAIGDR